MALCFQKKKKIYGLLNGISHDDLDSNIMYFKYVQSFISLSNCSVNFYSFVYVLFDRHMWYAL